MQGIYYVKEQELFEDVLDLYDSNQFPSRLFTNLQRMTKRIVGSRRFDSCSDLLREEMNVEALTHVCLKLWERKYDLKHGSRVYSWASRVILNRCLQLILKEQATKKKVLKYAQEAFINNAVEILPTVKSDI